MQIVIMIGDMVVDKVKKFVVLPVGLLIIHLLMSRVGSNLLGYWTNFRLDFWQKLGYSLLSLFGHAAYIFWLALLFVIVFTKNDVRELLKKPALKAMKIVFFAELIFNFLRYGVLIPLINRPALEAVKHGIQMNEWYSVIFNGLLPTVVGFAVVYFTLRLLIKPLNLSFSFHKTAFFLLFFLCIAVSVLENYGLLQFVNYLNVSGGVILETVRVFGTMMTMDQFNAILSISGGLIITLLDVMIFAFINHCTKENAIESPFDATPAPMDESNMHS